ncbi:MAG: sulfite exporter TauE/SafE family protein [Nostocales cyanobacterium]|nr:MAG: sulfite exporter TauE/SafE family protein [Nostocales cyanobacterium]TAF19488.1 MAG: sulfite exporter TauE/SafE family protein [Nostocales cyanobacterium]
MLGAFLGARIATLPMITETLQLILFILTMFVAAYFMIINASDTEDSELELNKKEDHHISPWLIIPIEGLGVGILSGLVGVGGGFLIIPALVLVGNTPIKEAVGTSLVIIALKSITGFIGYFGFIDIDINLIFTFTLAASLGMLIGANFTRYIQGKDIKKAFGYFVILVAIFMLSKSGLVISH